MDAKLCERCKRAPKAGRSPRCEPCKAAHRRETKSQQQRDRRDSHYTSRDKARDDLLAALPQRVQALDEALKHGEQHALQSSKAAFEALQMQPAHRAATSLVRDLQRLIAVGVTRPRPTGMKRA